MSHRYNHNQRELGERNNASCGEKKKLSDPKKNTEKSERVCAFGTQKKISFRTSF